MSLDLGGEEYRAKIKFSTERLLSVLAEHHDYSIVKPPPPKPKIKKSIPIVVRVEKSEPIEVLVLPIPEATITIEGIKRVVCRHFGLSHSDIISQRRHHVAVIPRQVSMYIAKVLTPRSLPEIGRRFGGRDHTTVLHAVRKIERLLLTDEKLAADVAAIKAMVLA